jgi:hypothetical protein
VKPSARQVLDYLRLRGADGATPAEARAALACDRLAARVYELKSYGYTIETLRERTPMGAVIARYVLVERPRSEPMRGDQTALPL